MNEIDQKALDNVRALQQPGAIDLLTRIIDIFVVQTPKDVEAIIDSVATQDLETIRISAHSAKSSSAYVGATQFSARMSNIERAAREGELTQIHELTEGLAEHTQNVIGELLAFRQQAA